MDYMAKHNEASSSITVDTLNFVEKNILNVTDLTRTNKLAEILENFANDKTEEVYIIQNAKNKHAKGVFVDLEFFQELLRYKEMLEDSLDAVLLEEASKRINSEATLSLSDVFTEDEIDFDQLAKELGD